jgi:putative toxin-antitoxin system antitoxin component (TIGR02293 family)
MGKPVKRRYSGRGAIQERAEVEYGAKSPLAKKQIAPAKVIRQISKGLPFSELEHLRSEIDEPLEALARQLSISRSTLQRRKTERRLSPEESDRVMRFWRILKYAINLFGTLDRARQWLKFPQFGLGGAVPLEFAKTEVGGREVEDLLGRIDYGVYS